MFDQFEQLLISLAQTLPLPLFAFVSSFVEEVIAPIPSGAITLLIGSVANVQGYTIPLLFVLAVIASAGKVCGGLVIYFIADKAEDFATSKFSRYLGITHSDIEKFGSRFGNGWKDYLLLTTLRAIPIIPSVVISFGAGIIRIPLRLFIVATFVGSIIRDLIVITIGYAGLDAATSLLSNSSDYESLIKIGITIAFLICAVAYLYTRKRNK